MSQLSFLCGQCDKEMSIGAKFCGGCGAKVESITPLPQVQASAPEPISKTKSVSAAPLGSSVFHPHPETQRRQSIFFKQDMEQFL